jgi:hypothetical protein
LNKRLPRIHVAEDNNNPFGLKRWAAVAGQNIANNRAHIGARNVEECPLHHKTMELNNKNSYFVQQKNFEDIQSTNRKLSVVVVAEA